ncbi:hypothetical protein OD91_2694 [Lutibacter sp. Hel_I_33_5]|uniref:hypothetical protein n=1 Tax=Lutibacter sp. Hel_I_33_5 TaxID=1566289 RepID=UPI0011A260F3|nr:hypothetical protein [Lutibacter sp. Hel_I_33_5]TVZ57373.1 hypothetical protein OD91_2694 [Lutibacter sp. Hel_I_33_5]
MPKDIREVLENYKEETIELSSNHSKKFETKLLKELHPKTTKKRSYKWLSIAASIVLLISLGIQFYPTDIEENPVIESEIPTKNISLETISPELNTIESYYANSINYELSQINMTKENKEMVDGYLARVGELTKEYKSLTLELNTNGVNDATIDALINNLQLRLQLLQRLKKQLKNLKKINTKQYETQQV